MLKTTRIGALALVVAGSIVVWGCQDEPTAPGLGALPVEVQHLGTGIHPVLALPGLEFGTPERVSRIRLHLFEVGQDNPLASYQGELRYDPKAVEVVEGSFPEGLLGAWNLVEPGLIRFAGIAPDGLNGVAALDLKVRALRLPSARDFQVQIEELVGMNGFVELTDRVAASPSPVLVTTASETLRETLRR